MDIIENEPERLAELRGITLEKAIAIGQTFREQAQLRALIMFFRSIWYNSDLCNKSVPKIQG